MLSSLVSKDATIYVAGSNTAVGAGGGSEVCMQADSADWRIGVVIPCHGDQSLLPDCLDSLAEFVQAGDWIIVVDGDDDPNVASMGQSRGMVYLRSPDSRRGVIIGRGVAWVLNQQPLDLLLICHSDMKLLPGTRTKLVAALGEHAKRRWGWLGHNIDDRRFKFRLLEWGNHLRGAIMNVPYGDQVMFVGVDLLASAGGWPFQPEMEDLELSLRLRRMTPATFVNAPAITGIRHWTGGVCNTTIRNWMLAVKYIVRRKRDRESL
jgi:glycosyltransferase involved in cell wall biosynthesis